jgi:hypothetical protein
MGTGGVDPKPAGSTAGASGSSAIIPAGGPSKAPADQQAVAAGQASGEIPTQDQNKVKPRPSATDVMTFADGVDGMASFATLPRRSSFTLRVGAQAATTQSYSDIAGAIGSGVIPGGAQQGTGQADVSMMLRTRYLDVGVSANAAAGASSSASSLTGLYNDFKAIEPGLTQLQADVSAFQKDFSSAETQGLLTTIQTQAAVLANAGASGADKLVAAGKIADAYNKLQPLLNRLNGLASSAEQQMAKASGFINGLQDGSADMSVRANAAGQIVGRVTGRIPLPSPTPAITDLNVAVTGHVHVVPNAPDALRNLGPEGMTLEKLAASASGTVRVTLQGVKELQAAAQEAKDTMAAVNAAKPYVSSLGAAAADPAGAQKALSDLTKAAGDLTDAVKDVEDKFSAKVGAELTTTQPTSNIGVGFGVGMGATFFGRSRWSVMLDNIGYMAGRDDHYAMGKDITGGTGTPLTYMGSTSRNVFNDFNPLTVRVIGDTRLSDTTGTRLITGLESRIGDSTALYAGVIQPVGKYVSFNTGYMYDTAGSHLVTAGAGLGPVRLQVGANHVVPDQVTSVQGSLMLQGTW